MVESTQIVRLFSTPRYRQYWIRVRSGSGVCCFYSVRKFGLFRAVSGRAGLDDFFLSFVWMRMIMCVCFNVLEFVSFFFSFFERAVVILSEPRDLVVSAEREAWCLIPAL